MAMSAGHAAFTIPTTLSATRLANSRADIIVTLAQTATQRASARTASKRVTKSTAIVALSMASAACAAILTKLRLH